MSWPASLGIGALTAVVAGILAGVVANLCVGWYRISSFEGAAGYWVVAMALLGAAGGGIIGVVISRLIGAPADPGFLKALGLAQAVVVLLLAGIGGTARLLADVPPRLDGQRLVLAIELEWPEGRSPADEPDGPEWYLRLHAMSGRVARASTDGPLWREDARLEQGRWIVPGALDVFTSRGKRVLTVAPDSLVGEGFQVPLPGHPGRESLAWSEWLPRERVGSAPDGGRFRYRFRVVPADQPIRLERIGPFEVATIASGFGMYSWDNGPMRWSASARFEVRVNGNPLVIEHRDAETDTTGRFTRMDAVAVVEGTPPALMVQVDAPAGEGPCYLVVANGDGVRTEEVGICGDRLRAAPLTSDSTRFADASGQPRLEGRIDRVSYRTPGPYLIRDVVLDTRTLTARRFSRGLLGNVIERIPPLGVAPDGLSFVRLAWDGGNDAVALLVMDLVHDAVSSLPVDRSRMRYAEIDQIDPAWLLHYFAWHRDPSGQDRLVERAGVAPLPHRGILSLDRSGYREYRLAPAEEGLRAALVEFLVAELGGEAGTADSAEFSHAVRVGEAIVHVSYSADAREVGVWMDRGTDSQLVATIAERFDAALRSGRYDHLFGS